MDRIKAIRAREILDSRGLPTVEAEVHLNSGLIGRAAVPSGASTGKFEAVELRDGDKKRFHGKGVLKAIKNIVEEITPAVLGLDPIDQEALDKKILSLDPSAQKEKLGANATLAVSMAATRASALVQKITLAEAISRLFKTKEMKLPVPFMNVVNGGMHADNNLDFQEFMIVPLEASSFSEALRMGSEIFQTLKTLLRSKDLSTSVGDEGGFAPRLRNHEEALQFLFDAINHCGYGAEVKLALDVAASSFYEEGKYVMKKSGQGTRTSEEMVGIYKELLRQFPIVSIEDALDEEDWKGWKQLTVECSKVQLVGDDLFVTQTARRKRKNSNHKEKRGPGPKDWL